MKAGAAGVPMVLATLGGPATLFKESIDAYRSYLDHFNHQAQPVAITALFHVAKDIQTVLRRFYPYVDQVFRTSNGSGFSKQLFARQVDKGEVMLIGDVNTIVDKILYQYDLYQHDRLLLQIDIGGLPFEVIKEQIEIIGKEIAPCVRAAIKERRNA